MKLWNRIFLAALIFLLIAVPFSGFKQTAHAAGSTASIEVIGDKGQVLQPETSTNIDSNSTALSTLQKVVETKNVTVSNGMITGIDGLNSPSDWSAYWAFYINGVSASVGADKYQPTNGDNILFQYHPYPGLLNDEVSVTVNNGYGTNVKLDNGSTVLSVLQKLEGQDQVVVQNNKITSIAGQKADSTHAWKVTLKRSGTNPQVVTDLNTPLHGQDQITFTLENVTQTPSQTTPSITLNQINSAINNATTYVNKHGVSDWNAIALSKAGKSIPSSYLKGVADAIKSAGGQFHAITDPERYTLGVLAAGGDPTTLAGANLVKAIYNGDVTKQGLNGVIFGLAALGSANLPVPSQAKWTKEKLATYLLQHQNTDGGWAWDGSQTSDLDTTGMALTALSTQSSNPKVLAAIQKAEGYLSSQFKAGKVDNSSTAAQLVIGLTANGVNPEGVEYTKTDGTTLLAYLLTFQTKDGGFNWKAKDESTFSTDQGFLALVAEKLYMTHEGPLYSFKWTQAKPIVAKTTVAKSHTQTGEPLPNTATPFYNYLILGLMLVLLGLFTSIYFNRKRA